MAREGGGRPAWELGATLAGVRLDGAFAGDEAQGWVIAPGARAAWRPVPSAVIGVEAWRASLGSPTESPDSADPASTHAWAVAAVFRATPAAGRGWPIEPALHFGIETVRVDDATDRSVAFVAGGGLLHAARRWVAGVAVRNHHVRVEEEGGVGRDADLWEFRAEVAVVLGGDGG